MDMSTPPQARAMPLLVDRVHRLPRLWSNQELARIGAWFDGDVVNVSAWRDEDKAGKHYRDYFSNARSYTLTNFDTDKRGFQGLDGEVFLDLEKDIPSDLARRFDVVFNHTTLEHVYEFRRAFSNLCAMSRDAVIVVAPWLQPLHSHYGDYWRFSPQALARLFADAGFTPAHISWNRDKRASVYVFAVGVRDRSQWADRFSFACDPSATDFHALPEDFAGRAALPEPALDASRSIARRLGLGALKRRASSLIGR